MSSIRVIGLGALNIDNIYRVERVLGDAETAAASTHAEIISRYKDSGLEQVSTCPGGSAANTIHGLARLGVSTGFAGVIGDDDGGKTILEDFESAGVDTSRIKVKPAEATGSALCLSDSLNLRSIHVAPGANSRLTTADLDISYLNRAEILHISSFVDDAQLDVILELTAKLNPSVKISFSPGELYAVKGSRVLAPLLSRTYVLFANEKEIEQLTGRDIENGAAACLEMGCRIVAVTLGKGAGYKNVTATSYIRDAEQEHVIQPAGEDISGADTIGAGDAFAAGFLYGRLNGKGLKECGQIGNTAARLSIRKTGARAGNPTLAELSVSYRELYKTEL